MLLIIPDVLSRDEALALRAELIAEDWVDGNITSGAGAALAKRNHQLPESSAAMRQARARVASALAASPLFLSAALPRLIAPMLFNRYAEGDGFAAHVDNAIRLDGLSGQRLRTDLSATLFLTDPADYDGGDLCIEGLYGATGHKLEPGQMLLYPSTSLHSVMPITRGERLSCFFWLESMVRDNQARALLFDLDQSIQHLTLDRGGDDTEVLRLTQIYHNLMRRWAIA